MDVHSYSCSVAISPTCLPEFRDPAIGAIRMTCDYAGIGSCKQVVVNLELLIQTYSINMYMILAEGVSQDRLIREINIDLSVSGGGDRASYMFIHRAS